jgi:hypothetical protein
MMVRPLRQPRAQTMAWPGKKVDMKRKIQSLVACLAMLLVVACGGGKDESSPSSNAVPVADAGASRTVSVGSAVTLDGSASRDPGGAALSYSWALVSRPSGSNAVLSSTTSVSPSFTADVAGSYGVSLVVGNGSASSSAVQVTLSAVITNAAPTARAGSNQSVLAGTTVQLDGTASTDPEGQTLTHTWTLVLKPDGSQAVLSDSASPRPTFVADLVGPYTLALSVNDGALSSVTSLVFVTAALDNIAPVARTGADQQTIPGARVTLNGSASSDANADVLSYRWALSSRPAGSAAALSDADMPISDFVPDIVGSYVATLVVSDGVLDSAPVSVTVTVVDANVPPVADAGPEQQVPAGATATLDGSLSTDVNGDALSYFWSLTSRPVGSAARLVNRTGPTLNFGIDVPGLYVVALVVNDGRADSAAATVAINGVIPALPVGAGTFAQTVGGLPFNLIDETTGVATAQASACAAYSAADLTPEGVVLAVSSAVASLIEVDVRVGLCRDRFAVAEPMAAIAVAGDGTVHLLSQATAATGARQLYRYSAGGTLLSRAALSGNGGGTGPGGVPDLLTPEGMDFAPDGTLLVIQGGTVWRVDAVTGVGTLRATGLGSSGDIDIDAAGRLRALSAGRLDVYDIGTWSLMQTVALQPAIAGPSALVHR